MYKQYEDNEEGRCKERLEHPYGEEYPGQYDAERKYLMEHSDNPSEIEKKYGKLQGIIK